MGERRRSSEVAEQLVAKEAEVEALRRELRLQLEEELKELQGRVREINQALVALPSNAQAPVRRPAVGKAHQWSPKPLVYGVVSRCKDCLIFIRILESYTRKGGKKYEVWMEGQAPQAITHLPKCGVAVQQPPPQEEDQGPKRRPPPPRRPLAVARSDAAVRVNLLTPISDGCRECRVRPRVARGLCLTCYSRWYRGSDDSLSARRCLECAMELRTVVPATHGGLCERHHLEVQRIQDGAPTGSEALSETMEPIQSPGEEWPEVGRLLPPLGPISEWGLVQGGGQFEPVLDDSSSVAPDDGEPTETWIDLPEVA